MYIHSGCMNRFATTCQALEKDADKVHVKLRLNLPIGSRQVKVGNDLYGITDKGLEIATRLVAECRGSIHIGR